MVLKVPVPGIDQFLNDIPDGSTLLLDGEFEGTQSFLAQILGWAANKAGREVMYITSRQISDVVSEVRRFEPERIPFYIVESVPIMDWKQFISSRSLLIVDSFSYMVMDLDPKEMREALVELRKTVKEAGANLILVSHLALSDPDKDAIVRYLMDSVVDFRCLEDDEFIRRYLRVHKWSNQLLDQFIFYKIEQGRMDIDLRARVI